MAKKEIMQFYDLKKKKRFKTDDYKIVVKKAKKGNRIMYAAVAKGPSGNDCWLIVGKDKAAQLKKQK